MAQLPPQKRRKFEDTSTLSNNAADGEDAMTLIPVLPDYVTAPVPLVTVYAAAILDKRKTSEILRHLSSIHPLEGLAHIKRVRKQTSEGTENGTGGLEIVLCPTSKIAASDEPSEVFLEQVLPKDICKGMLGKPFVASVAKAAPQTRQQYEEASRHWPSAFHEDKELAMLISGKLFSASDREKIHGHMKEIIGMEENARKNGQGRTITALMVDPKTDVTLARCIDRVDGRRNPIHHAVMKCVDLISHCQGGGAWPVDRDDSFLLAMNEGDDLPYLCTGYDLYITQEPCAMCAMALVHSRIRRVFYHSCHPDGALGSKYKLHTEPGINHRFRVFQVTLRSGTDR